VIKLVVGLGNPGSEYEKTRHNAGFLFLDFWLEKLNGRWYYEPKFDGLVAVCSIESSPVFLLKPLSFMNRSGVAVGKLARYYKIAPEEILVVHDELDFEVGVVKFKYDGGHAGHNGLRDIINHLNSNAFYRIRIGIGKSFSGGGASYVLSDLSGNDLVGVESAFDCICTHINEVIAEQSQVIVNKVNGMIR